MLTDTERAALVEELARAASGLVQGSPYDLASVPQKLARQKAVEYYIMPIIDRLLADRDAEIREALLNESGCYGKEHRKEMEYYLSKIGLTQEWAER